MSLERLRGAGAGAGDGVGVAFCTAATALGELCRSGFDFGLEVWALRGSASSVSAALRALTARLTSSLRPTGDGATRLGDAAGATRRIGTAAACAHFLAAPSIGLSWGGAGLLARISASRASRLTRAAFWDSTRLAASWDRAKSQG